MEENKQQESPKEVRTEVTSVAQEELKTGQKVKVPTAEELVSKATVSMVSNMQMLEHVFGKLSARGKNRALIAILNLPMDDLPVGLRTIEEKQAFVLGQRIIADRFLITQHHINQEVKRIREEKQKQQDAQAATSENTPVDNASEK